MNCDWCGNIEGDDGLIYRHSQNVSNPNTGHAVRIDVKYQLDGSYGQRAEAYLHPSCLVQALQTLTTERTPA